MRRGLPGTDAERSEHLQALEARGIIKDYAGHFAFLYESLGILDSKASSLLTFNAVGLTALAIWLANVPLNLFHLTLDISFLGFLVSCILCLRIVWLHWASTADLMSERRYLLELLAVRDSRTVLYRWAWLLAITAVVITALATVYHVFETLFGVYFHWALGLPADSSTTGSPGF